MSAFDERQVVQNAREGDAHAFRVLVEHFMKSAYNIAYGVVRNHDDAEDVVQEAFVNVHRHLRSFRGEAEFSTWLYRIVMNLSLNRVRQRATRLRHEVAIVDPASLSVMPAADPSQFDVPLHIERALGELSTLQRTVVILRHMNGFSTRQVSAILKCSDGTVKTHLHRGLKRMKILLNHLKETPEC